MERAGPIREWLTHQLYLLGHSPVTLPTLPVEHATVGIDGSSSAELAAAWAGRLARHTHLVTCVDPAGALAMEPLGAVPSGGWMDRLRTEAKRSINRVLSEDPSLDYEHHEREDAPGRGLDEACVETNSDLLAVGQQGGGIFDRAMLGSVSEQLTHHARLPVLVAKTAPEVDRVVVGVGEDHGSSLAAQWAAALALHLDTELVVATSVDGQDDVKVLDDDGPDARFVTVPWPPRKGIARLASNDINDLVVVGHGRRPGWLGSNAISLVRHVDDSVLVVKPRAKAGEGPWPGPVALP